MTISELREKISDWSDYVSFCEEEELYDLIEDIVYTDDYDENIDEDVIDYLECSSWRSLYRALEDLPDGYSWYRKNGCLDYYGLDDYDDLDYAVNDLIDYLGENWFEDEVSEESESDDDAVFEEEEYHEEELGIEHDINIEEVSEDVMNIVREFEARERAEAEARDTRTEEAISAMEEAYNAIEEVQVMDEAEMQETFMSCEEAEKLFIDFVDEFVEM